MLRRRTDMCLGGGRPCVEEEDGYVSGRRTAMC